jgi:DNA sulfur modification protein DndE
LLTATACLAKQSSNLSDEEALNLATKAYIYAYPMVTMDLTRRVMTNIISSDGTRGPMGSFTHVREFPNPSFRDVTTPNDDTLYSAAWLDLSKEPYILHIPNEAGRYYLMPILSLWTEVIFSPGTRTTGTNAQDYAIAGPYWKGRLPAGMKVIQSPTNIVWIIGRTYTTGTAADLQAVHAIQDHYTVTPLRFYNQPYSPPEGTIDPSVNMRTPVRDQVNAMDAASYFGYFATLLKDNPPTKADGDMVAILAQLGIVPGKPFDINKVNPVIAKALKQSVQNGQVQIKEHFGDAGVVTNGWLFSTKTGSYGTDYLQRAFVTEFGLGANLPQDAIYPTATVDSAEQALNGANHYVMHFDKGELPPVNGFWSLTMYDKQLFFVDNPINRYSISQRDHLQFNKDGSVDLYIQHDSPGKNKEANWLPAPKGDFVLMFRFYWPKDRILIGTWNPPKVVKQ